MVPQDDEEAEKWFRLAADQGHADAHNWLYKMFVQGKIPPLNRQEAIQWYTQAGQEGYAEAQNFLGEMYLQGHDIAQDDQEAEKWFRLAADQGHADAQSWLYKMFVQGKVSPLNSQEGIQWYTQAAQEGHAEAQNKLGEMIAMGEGTDQDDKKAVKWFRSAAEQGNVDALINLGDCYLLSRGVDYSIQNASDCYIKAGDDAKSQKRLQMIATRGYLQNTLTVRSNNINQLVSRNEYVIFLPEENCLLYPLDGTVTITPEISEGKHVDIQTDIEKIGENLKVHFKIETDFLIQKLLLDSAPVPLDSLEPSEQPQYLLGEASVVVTPQHIADGFAITIVSRNDAEHVKRLSYNDGKLTVISAEDMLKY
jgi:TPR repeat protein